MSNTHRRRRRDSTVDSSRVGRVYKIRDSLDEFANSKVELCHVGAVITPVGSRDPVYNNPVLLRY